MDVSESVVAVLLELTPVPNMDHLATLSLARAKHSWLSNLKLAFILKD